MDSTIREPKQKRAIEKKEKIIRAGFDLICENGYYNINTAEIAKRAGVSTGIVYQYFKDKHAILMEGLNRYGDTLFYPMIKVPEDPFDKKHFPRIIKSMIQEYIQNHKVSKTAHEEIMAMVHSDPEVAAYFYKREWETTAIVKEYLMKNQFSDLYLSEKIHISLGLIDNLCHEIIYHKHDEMDYDRMIEIVICAIEKIFQGSIKK